MLRAHRSSTTPSLMRRTSPQIHPLADHALTRAEPLSANKPTPSRPSRQGSARGVIEIAEVCTFTSLLPFHLIEHQVSYRLIYILNVDSFALRHCLDEGRVRARQWGESSSASRTIRQGFFSLWRIDLLTHRQLVPQSLYFISTGSSAILYGVNTMQWLVATSLATPRLHASSVHPALRVDAIQYLYTVPNPYKCWNHYVGETSCGRIGARCQAFPFTPKHS